MTEDHEKIELLINQAFEDLGVSVGKLRATRDQFARAGVSLPPQYRDLYERIDRALVAAKKAYSENARAAHLGLKGEEVIGVYCARMGFADFVVDGGLDYLVPSWQQTVEEIERGYKGLVEEYMNDMDGRRILHEVWPLASADQASFYQARVDEADNKFFAATVPAEECILGGHNEARHGYRPEVDWWYYRVPKDKGPNW
jgi:hypothetical protein